MKPKHGNMWRASRSSVSPKLTPTGFASQGLASSVGTEGCRVIGSTFELSHFELLENGWTIRWKKRETITQYLSEKTTTKNVALRLHTISVQLSEGADTAKKGPCIARRCSCDSPSRVTASFTPTKSLLVNILKSWSYIKGRRVLHGPFSSIYLS